MLCTVLSILQASMFNLYNQHTHEIDYGPLFTLKETREVQQHTLASKQQTRLQNPPPCPDTDLCPTGAPR